MAKLYRNIPDFLIIGAGKSGTTSLDNYLKQHPEIFIPSVKEPNFYGYEFTKIDDFKGDLQEINHYKSSVTNLEAYLALFAKAKGVQVMGETSNTYLYHESAPSRIFHYNPKMKLIAIFRQPADRLYSRFLHLARENKLPTTNFADCLDKNTIWWRRNDLINEGFYYRNLSRFYDLFPATQIKIYLYEELSSNTDLVLKDLYEFIGVDTTFNAQTEIRYNESGLIKNNLLDKLYGSRGIAQRIVKNILPQAAIEKLRSNLTLQRTINELRGKNLSKPKMDSLIRKKLTEEVYSDDISKLEKLTNRDLQIWK